MEEPVKEKNNWEEYLEDFKNTCKKIGEKVLELTKHIVEKDHITCMMITHNMHQALELGNRTFLMSDGNIVLDVKGEERKGLTVDDLLDKFRQGTGKDLDNDRILLST